MFNDWIRRGTDPRARRTHEQITDLADVSLACWCPPHESCHGETLLDLLADARAVAS